MEKKAPPYTDMHDLIEASVDQVTDAKVSPAIKALTDATSEFRAATPILNQVNRRLNTHETWLYVLTALNIAGLMLDILK